LGNEQNRNNQTSSRLIIGQLFADIVADPKFPDSQFHWVVQQIGSTDILAFGQESSRAAAEAAALQYLKDRQANVAKQTG
jgi:hypothetical protein